MVPVVMTCFPAVKTAELKNEIKWDATKPDGMYRKLMDSSKARVLGWKPEISLEEGIQQTILEYRSI